MTGTAANRLPPLTGLGCVVIGRNEGERLRRCIRSLSGRGLPIVYVDSGSADDSVAFARDAGCRVVELDPALPFTAARARNAGFAALAAAGADLAFVQFVDGDCEIDSDWLTAGVAHLRQHPELGIVCGRQREERPTRNIFHRLFDIEWDAPIGPGAHCTGNTMVRASRFAELGGFRDDLIAGEEPELCVRMRMQGAEVERLDVAMATHDANMTRFRQWWRRSVRAGHAYAEGARQHGRGSERHNVRAGRRIVVFGLALPTVVVATTAVAGPIGLVPSTLYALSMARTFRHYRARGLSRRVAVSAAGMMTLGRFAEAQGWLGYHWARAIGRRRELIEYRGSAAR